MPKTRKPKKKTKKETAEQLLHKALNTVASKKYKLGATDRGLEMLLQHAIMRSYSSDAVLQAVLKKVLPDLEKMEQVGKNEVYDIIAQIRNTYQNNFIKTNELQQKSKPKASTNRLTESDTD